MGKQVFGIALIDSAVVSAGDPLKGVLWIDLDKECKANGIQLQFSGVENSLIMYTRASNNHQDNTVISSTPTDRAWKSSNLINVNLPVDASSLIQSDGTIQPGTYEVPFEIHLPNMLPGSVQEKYHDGSYCEIAYELKAEITGAGGGLGGLVFANTYKCEQKVLVNAQPLSEEHVPYVVPPCTEAVSMLCCLSQGSITVTAAVSDTKMSRGEVVPVALAARNHSSAAVSKIQARLLQHCEWKVNHHVKRTNTVLQTVEFKGLLADLMLPNNTPGDNSSSLQETLLREVRQGNHTCELIMPATAHGTYTGKLFTVKHTVEITVETGNCVTNPVLTINVQAGPPAVDGKKKPSSLTLMSTPVPWASGATTVPTFTKGQQTVLGGTPTNGENPPMPSSLAKAKSHPSVATLLEEMSDSLQDLGLIQGYVADSSWYSVLSQLSMADYGTIVGRVSSDFEQAAVAETLARVIMNFTCAHAAAAVQACADWNRTQIVVKLLPLCHDKDFDLIRNCLDDWEILTTKTAFEAASK